jgi:hypothetical protein
MRNTVIGVVLAVAFVAAMFALSLRPHVSAPLYVQAASDVRPGFAGMKRIGRWVLVCPKASPADAAGSNTAIPFSLNPSSKTAAAPVADQTPMARCRIVFQYPQKNNPKLLLMRVNFRYTKDQKHLAMVIMFPAAWAQKGDNLVAVMGNRGFPLPVRQCAPNGFCMASGFLDQAGQNLILSVKQAAVKFPTPKGAKPLFVPVPFLVLKDALAALKRADS